MKRSYWCSGTFVGFLVFVLAVGVAQDPADYDRTEYNGCKDCHFSPGEEVMTFTADTWLESGHAYSYHGYNGNNYCAKCMSPFQADPAATYGENEPVPLEEWQAVTCGSCHPPHELREEWGTPIGIYDVDEGWWSPVYEGEVNSLCEHCHSGSHHQKFLMYQMADLQCIDCHMPKMPISLDGSARMTRSHNFEFPLEDEEALFEKASFSCGTEGLGCHSTETTEWAVEYIRSGIIHVKGKAEVLEILAFIDDAVAEGTLGGEGWWFFAEWNLATMQYALEQALVAIEDQQPEDAFWWLLYAYFACDGSDWPIGDLVTGEAGPELNGMILDALWEIW